ncbi:unnamed protein product [Calicophoron daubneyi]|uniref:Uncharacterized protein n=1 Tax=Calicophoron daubneyi TaxID=300641 RepID=A0AAV2THE5_CALDB
MNPNYGTLKPFQRSPVLFRLSPRWPPSKYGFHSCPDLPPSKPFSIYLRITKVGVGVPTESDKTGSEDDSQDLEIVVTGTLVPVQMAVLPIAEKPVLSGQSSRNEDEVISSNSKLTNSEEQAEVAPLPGGRLSVNFRACPVGGRLEASFWIVNQAKDLPLRFKLPRVAHFTSMPGKGKIKPGEQKIIKMEFLPRQYGNFEVFQPLIVLGKTLNPRTQKLDYDAIIYETAITLRGTSVLATIPPRVRFNPGIVPLIKNEVGSATDMVYFGSEFPCPRQAVVRAKDTQGIHGLSAHTTQEWQTWLASLTKAELSTVLDKFIAFPNDRSGSIRPAEKEKEYRTLFCRLARYTYTDPDFEYTEKELTEHMNQLLPYVRLIRKQADLLYQKMQDQKMIRWEKEPYDGTAPFRLDEDEFFARFSELRSLPRNGTNAHRRSSLLDAKSIEAAQLAAIENEIQGPFPTEPSSRTEREECRRKLSPKELHQIAICPLTIDFGEVCPNTRKPFEVTVVNPLDHCILLTLDLDIAELSKTCPRSFLVRANNTIKFSVTFETSQLGKFQRNLNFSINKQHSSNLVVCATVVPVHLEILPSVLELTAAGIGFGLVAESGVRGVVTLQNALHAPAEFVWEPSDPETSFTIRPRRGRLFEYILNKLTFSCPFLSSGYVEPFSSLACEVVHYPSLSSAQNETFTLLLPALHTSSGIIHTSNDTSKADSPSIDPDARSKVRPDNQYKLRCTVRLPPCRLAFGLRRLALGPIAHSLPYKRHIRLSNYGQGPAFYRIQKQCETVQATAQAMKVVARRLSTALPARVDIAVKPSEGEVPIGGSVQLEITCTATGLGKFESCLLLTSHDGRTTTLSVCGSVVAPEVEISSDVSDFGGVYVGGSYKLPFGIHNKGTTTATIEFDFTDHPEFRISNTLSLAPKEGKGTDEMKCYFEDPEDEDCEGVAAQYSAESTLVFDAEEKKSGKIHKIFIESGDNWVGSIVFTPKEVAFHDFPLGITINKLPFECPNLRQNTTTGSPSSELQAIRQSHRILAVGLRQPVSLTPAGGSLCFEVVADPNNNESVTIPSKVLVIRSTMKARLHWAISLIGLQQYNRAGRGQITVKDMDDRVLTYSVDGLLDGYLRESEEVHLTFQCVPRKPVSARIVIPLWLAKASDEDSEGGNPGETEEDRRLFKLLRVRIRVTQPSLTCDPPCLLLPPVPPGIEIRVPVRLQAHHILASQSISVCWPAPENPMSETAGQRTDLECPFTVEFQEGQIMSHKSKDNVQRPSMELIVWVRYRCNTNGLVLAPRPRPACLLFVAACCSTESDLNITRDQVPVCVALPVSAAVDDSIMSWFDYIARRPREFQLAYNKNVPKMAVFSDMQETKQANVINVFYQSLADVRLIQNSVACGDSQQSLITTTEASEYGRSRSSVNSSSLSLFHMDHGDSGPLTPGSVSERSEERPTEIPPSIQTQVSPSVHFVSKLLLWYSTPLHIHGSVFAPPCIRGFGSSPHAIVCPVYRAGVID